MGHTDYFRDVILNTCIIAQTLRNVAVRNVLVYRDAMLNMYSSF
jgi:hypothetical protein